MKHNIKVNINQINVNGDMLISTLSYTNPDVFHKLRLGKATLVIDTEEYKTI